MSMKRMLVWGWMLMLVLLSVGTVWASKPIRIGLMAPLTGPWASEGEEMKNIVELLAEGVNAHGGLLNCRIEVVLGDDGGDPKKVPLVAQRLVDQKVIAVIGSYTSGITEIAQGIYDKASILHIATAATSIRLSKKGLKYFFRTCPRDDEQEEKVAETIQKLGLKRVAILHDTTDYPRTLGAESRDLFKKMDMEVVFFDGMTPGGADCTEVLARMRKANPEVIFFTGYYPEAGILLREKKKMNWGIPVIGEDGTNNRELVEIAGKDAAAGYYFISAAIPKDLPYERTQAFIRNYKTKYGKEPGSIWAILAGDAFLNIRDAIRETNSTEVDKLEHYLHNRKPWYTTSGLTGDMNFDAQGDRIGDVYRLYRVDEAGNFVLQQEEE